MLKTFRSMTIPWFRSTGFLLLVLNTSLIHSQGLVCKPPQKLAKQAKAFAASAVVTDPDLLSVSDTRPPLPKGRGPTVTETVGTDRLIRMISDTIAEQSIQIDRIVSYNTIGGRIDSDIASSGTLSRFARLKVLFKCTLTEPEKDRGKRIRISFSSFNDKPLPNSTFYYTLGADIEDLDLGAIATENVVFGQAKFDPMKQSANDLHSNPEFYKPTPGINKLQFSLYSTGNGTAPLIGRYTAVLYTFLEFDAVAPIILVHGTNANHTSWEDPVGSALVQGDCFVPIVPGYFGPAGWYQGSYGYKGVWFYNFDLDQSIGWWGGNDEIDVSGMELAKFIDATLNALGSRTCHIIAHSKGGSDSRSLLNYKDQKVFIPVSTTDPDLLKTKIRILSLYTLGTPHLGTPLSDLAYATKKHYEGVYDGINSSNNDIDAMITSVHLMQIIHKGPAGGALRDQMTGARNKQYFTDRTQEKTGGHFYSVVGDADLNRNGIIDMDESSVIFPPPPLMNDQDATHIYRILGRLRKIKMHIINTTMSESGGTPAVELQGVTLNNTDSEPNDLVTPFWSAFGPSAKPFQVTRAKFTVKSGRSVDPYVSQNEFSKVLTPGNHSLLKDVNTASSIMYQITHLDYPLKDFQ